MVHFLRGAIHKVFCVLIAKGGKGELSKMMRVNKPGTEGTKTSSFQVSAFS